MRYAPDRPMVAALVVACSMLGGSAALAQSAGSPVTINGAAFVHVLAGPFVMGTPIEPCVRAHQTQTPESAEAQARARQYCARFEGPEHRVTLEAFYIMRTEVTVAQYDRFVEATGARRPDDHRTQPGPGNPNPDESATGIPFGEVRRGPGEPVTDVSWPEAAAFCRWLGRGTGYATRLPTEAEWEKGARGGDGRAYPWGSTFAGQRLNFADVNSSAPWRDASVSDGFGDLAPVGSYPTGASPHGALDMAGNVSEWVSSLLWPYPYAATDGRESARETTCLEENAAGCRVYRGGSYRHSATRTRSASRVIASHLATRFVDIGIRCAASPP